MGLVEADVAQRGELARAPLAAHGVAVDGDAVHERRALGKVVPPLQVVEGAGGEHLHLVAAGQSLHEPPAVQLGAPRDLRPVALDDEGEPHAAATRASSRSYLSMMRSQV